jgi:hypothetical protein
MEWVLNDAGRKLPRGVGSFIATTVAADNTAVETITANKDL